MKKHSQKGVAHLGLLLLVLIVAVIGFAGYRVVQNNKKSPVASTTQSQTPAPVQTIRSTADLNSVEKTLNSTNLDSDLNPDSYNSDVQSLL